MLAYSTHPYSYMYPYLYLYMHIQTQRLYYTHSPLIYIPAYYTHLPLIRILIHIPSYPYIPTLYYRTSPVYTAYSTTYAKCPLVYQKQNYLL